MATTHVPVLVEQVTSSLVTNPNGCYLDATFGGGGHTRALLAKLDKEARVLGTDRDSVAIGLAHDLAAQEPRFQAELANFSGLPEIARNRNFKQFDGILFDVGVSSLQLDDPFRGFSFQHEGPLDMRMTQTDDLTAEQWLNSASATDLAHVFQKYGQEKNARTIAKSIVANRPVTTTTDLVKIIQKSSNIVDQRKHIATRIFQALRIVVNDELNELRLGLRRTFDLLALSGRLAVISFHSLEHKLVRQQFSQWSEPPIPARVPVTGSVQGYVKIVEKGLRPTVSEVSTNKRARSALLQVIERVR